MNKSGIIIVNPLRRRIKALVRELERSFGCETKKIARNNYLLYNEEVCFDISKRHIEYIFYNDSEVNIYELNVFMENNFSGDKLGIHYYNGRDNYFFSDVVDYILV